MVKLNQQPGQYTMRASNYGANQIVSGFATLSYNGAQKVMEPTPFFGLGGVPTSSNVTLFNMTQLVPFENIPPSMNVSQTHVLKIARYGAPWVWQLDQVPYPQIVTEYAQNTPLLYYPNSTAGENEQLVIRTQNDTWVDIVFTVVNVDSPSHPMHKHSNKVRRTIRRSKLR